MAGGEDHGEEAEFAHAQDEEAVFVALLVEAGHRVILDDPRDGLGGGKAVGGQRAERGGVDVSRVPLPGDDEAAAVDEERQPRAACRDEVPQRGIDARRCPR